MARRPAAWRSRTVAWGYRAALAFLRVWWVLARPRSSGVRCVLRHDDALLLVRHSYGDRRWMLPGGRMRRGEAPVATAAREMGQELGIGPVEWTVTGCNRARSGYRRRTRGEGFRRHSTYYVAADVTDRAIRPRAIEIDAADWFAPGAWPADRAEALDEAAARG